MELSIETMIRDFMEQIQLASPWLIYLFLFCSAILQITFPPYPGDTILLFSGYLGTVDIAGGNIPIFLAYWIGTALTSYAIYEMGYFKGEGLLQLKLVKKYFPLASQEKAKKWVLKYGLLVFFISKFIPGLNSLIIVFGGILRYKKLWAYIGVGVTSLVHNIIFFLTGRAIGNNWDAISHFLYLYNRFVFGSIIVIALIYGVIWFRSKSGKNN